MSRQSYAQHLFKLDLPTGDPIIDVASQWASGERASAKDIRLAIRSAEQHRGGKDKMLRQRMGSVINRLERYLEYAEKGVKVYGERSLTTQPRSNPKKRRNPKRGAFYVHDQYLGDFLDFSSVKTAARYAKSRFGCEPASDCVYVEHEEALVPIGSLRGSKVRSNPYPHEHAARLIDPRKMIKTSFRRKNVKNGTIGLIMGKRTRTGPMTLQAVRFRAAHFTPAQARAWLKKHKLSPILFEPATKGRKAAWKAEGTRRKRSRTGKRRKVA